MNTVMKKFSASALALVFAFSAFAPAAQANQDLQALIASLLAQIASLQAQINGQTTPVNNNNTGGTTTQAGDYLYRPNKNVDYTFTKNLTIGARGEEVRKLQEALNQPAQYITGYFGPITKQAVRNFQIQTGITPTSGYFGPLTRAKINERAVITVPVNNGNNNNNNNNQGGNVTVTGDKLVVSGLASNDMLIGDSQKVIFTKLTLAAGDEDVKVKDIKVEVEGSANPNVIDQVLALDENMLEIDRDNPNNDGEAKLDVDVMVDDGKTVTVYIAAIMHDNSTGGTFITASDGLEVSIKVTEIVTDGADVEGTPVMGATHTVKDNVNVSASYDADINRETSTVKVGDNNVAVYEVTVDNTSSSDTVTLKSLKVGFSNATSTIDEEDLADITVEIDGKSYGGEVSEDDDREFIISFGDGIEIEDGDEVKAMVKVDVEGGAGQNFQFDIVDSVVVDEDGNILTDSTPANNIASSFVTVDSYSVSLSSSNEVGSENVAAGSEDIEFYSFEVTVAGGEDVTGDVTLDFTYTGTATNMNDVELTNVAIYTKDGDRVSDKEDVSFATSGTAVQVTFDDVKFDFNDDDEIVYIVKGDVPTSADNNATYAVGNASLSNLETVDTNENITAPTALTSTETQTVDGTELTVSFNSPSPAEINADKNGEVVAEIELDASDSGDDVKVTEINIDMTGTGTITNTNLSSMVENCELFDGNSSVSNKIDAGTGMSFNADTTVSKGTIKTLTLKCNIDNSVGSTPTSTISVTGAVGGTDDVKFEGEVTGTESDVDVSDTTTVTVVDGIISAAVHSSDTPDAMVVKEGTNKVVLGMLELTADQDDIAIDEVDVTITNETNFSGKVGVYVGNSKKGDVTIANGLLTINNLGIDVNDGDKVTLTFKADAVNTAPSTATSSALTVNAVRLEGSTTDNLPGTVTAFNAVTVVDALPVITPVKEGTLTMSTSLEADQEVLAFKIEADGGNVTVDDITLNATTVNGASLTAGEIKVYSDSAYNNEVATATVTDITVTGTSTAAFATPVTISDGDTYYFVYEADIATASGNSAVIELQDANASITFSAPSGINASEVIEEEIKATINTSH